MKCSKTHLVGLCVFLMASVSAYCQRGTFGIDVGQATDRFASQPSVSGLEFGIDGQLTVIKGSQKEGGPSIVAGGEIRIPSETSNHPKEYALYGGPVFQFRDFSVGVNAQLRKIYLPPSIVNNQFFYRDKMELFQLPVTIKYAFGPAKRAFVQAQGEPEFSPRFLSSSSLYALPRPNFDHGYTVGGSAGYTFGKWYYVKATYETRYFKFVENAGNPSNLYNWRSTMITGGIGFAF